ncbi:unnamed protein product [Notodromas monacha]|uniref:MBD domain-containing protein n=1 Tax=Notodromas monacha TaxID=399045 RepID=A0A7R9BI04_9CRUS|nr:unnamed protein product [Notodromas monacha]CAG0915077.1 unnamed protein product [Notodromas monacha]
MSEGITKYHETTEGVPPGWKILIKFRSGGATAGRPDYTFVAPSGKRLRSRVEVERFIQENPTCGVTVGQFEIPKNLISSLGETGSSGRKRKVEELTPSDETSTPRKTKVKPSVGEHLKKFKRYSKDPWKFLIAALFVEEHGQVLDGVVMGDIQKFFNLYPSPSHVFRTPWIKIADEFNNRRVELVKSVCRFSYELISRDSYVNAIPLHSLPGVSPFAVIGMPRLRMARFYSAMNSERFRSFVSNVKDHTVKISENLTSKLPSSTNVINVVRDGSARVGDAFRASNFGTNITSSTMASNLKIYSDRMATIIDHVRRGYDREEESTDIPEALFDTDEDDDDANGNLHLQRRRPRFIYSSDEEDDNAFLRRLKWPDLTDREVDTILGQLDLHVANKSRKKSGSFLKILEILPDDDDLNHNTRMTSWRDEDSVQASTASPANHSLQICFMNELATDSDEEDGPQSLPAVMSKDGSRESDFWRKQARLQAEARVALARACHLAKMRIEADRFRKKSAPLSELILLPPSCYGHRRLSRSLLRRLTVAELDSIHTSLAMEIKRLNEELVTSLMQRDELCMTQDSMLVDLEDLTRFMQAKGNLSVQNVPSVVAESDSPLNTQFSKEGSAAVGELELI